MMWFRYSGTVWLYIGCNKNFKKYCNCKPFTIDIFGLNAELKIYFFNLRFICELQTVFYADWQLEYKMCFHFVLLPLPRFVNRL